MPKLIPIFSVILRDLFAAAEEIYRVLLLRTMVRLIGTTLIVIGIVIVLSNPGLTQLWVVAISIGLLSHWVAEDQ